MLVKPPNRSNAVMAKRIEPADSLDDFPTPRWGTRALIEHALDKTDFKKQTVLDPCAGRGDMAEVLREYFLEVAASDIHDYGKGYKIADFLKPGGVADRSFDWVIMNPPFRLAEEFIKKARRVARIGVAALVRTQFLEGSARYEGLFRNHPPATVAPFVERLPMIKGISDPRATTATSYAWFIWDVVPGNGSDHEQTYVSWIPPCRRALEKASDYNEYRARLSADNA